MDVLIKLIDYNKDHNFSDDLTDEEYKRKAFFDRYGQNIEFNYQQDDNNNNYNKDQVKKDEENQKKIHVIYKYSQGIPLAKAILIKNMPSFLQLDNSNSNKPILSKRIELSDIDLEPPERTAYLSREYNFESIEEINQFIESAKKEDLNSLFIKVKVYWNKLIYANEDFINICTANTIFSYFQDKMGMCHYLLIVGDNNTGKSNILLLFSILGYRPLYDTAITPANIYNFGSSLDEGQGIIIEDEINDIDDQIEKKKIYQVSYRSGTRVTRMYDNNNGIGNVKRKMSRQQSFLPYCFKVFASEKMPDEKKSKGFIERLLVLKSISGDPQYDISEVVNDAGDERLKQLYKELLDMRKLLLIYRLLHYNDSFPDLKLNIKNRYKQLTKPLIRLFQNTESLNKIIKSLSKYLIEKNEKKINSLDSVLLTLIVDLVAKYGNVLYNEQIWQKIIERFDGHVNEYKPYTCLTEEFGIISKYKITNICETKFGAKPYKDRSQRGLKFDSQQLTNLLENYTKIDEIKIISKSGDRCDICDTCTENKGTDDREGVSENSTTETDMTALLT